VISGRQPASVCHMHHRDGFLLTATPSKSVPSKAARHRDALSPLSSVLTKTAGCHYAVVHSPLVPNPSPLTPVSFCFQRLTHSFALEQKLTLSFSTSCALFAKNTGGWGPTLASRFSFPYLSTSLRPYLGSSSPIASVGLGCENGVCTCNVLETSPLPPVSNWG